MREAIVLRGAQIRRSVVLVLFVVICGPSLPKESKQSQSLKAVVESRLDERGTDKSPLTVKVLPVSGEAEKGAREEAERMEKANQDRRLVDATIALAFVTAFLALFTAGLWLATYRLGRDARHVANRQSSEMQASLLIAKQSSEAAVKQAEVAREEFIYAHRPRLIVRREQLRNLPEQRGINFVLANTGNLVAANLSANINVRIMDASERTTFERESLPPYGDQWIDLGPVIGVSGRGGRTNLMSGERVFIFFASDQIDDESIVAVRSGSKILYFFGLVNFDDPGGTRRESAFFRVYRHMSDAFELKDDPDYEHI